MEANKENQQSIEQAFEQALDAYKAILPKQPVSGWLSRRTAVRRHSVRSARCMSADRAWKRMLKMPLNGQKRRLSKTIRLLCSIWRATMTRALA